MSAALVQDEPEAGAEYHVFAPSQVDTFFSCRRKWAWRRIAKVKTPGNDSAKLGTEVHKQLEDHLCGVGSFDFTHAKGAGYIAASGVHLIPDPSLEGLTEDEIVARAHAVQIETSFRFQSPTTKFVWNGRKDLEVDDSGVFPGLAEEFGLVVDTNGRTGIPAVGDHKSTSSLRWAKTPEDLKWDVQANVYAYALMYERRVPTVDLVWIYYQTKGARTAKRTHLRVHSEHAARAFRLIEGTAREMAAYVDASKKLDAEGPPDLRGFVQSMPPNPSACSAYGGCPFQHVCQLSLAERMRANMSDQGFFDSLRAKAQAEDAANGVTPAPAQPSVMGCAPTEVPAPTTLPAWLLKPLAPPAGSVAINPPEANLPPPTLPPEPAQVAPPEPAQVAPPTPVTPPPSDTSASADTSEMSSNGDEPKKGRGGRPKGSKNKPKDPLGADAHAHATLPAQATLIIASEAAAPRELTATFDVDTSKAEAKVEALERRIAALDSASFGPDLDSFTLYVDCMPAGGGCASVDTYVARAKEVIAKTDFPDGKGGTMRVADYRFLPFGQGAGALLGATIAEIDKDPPSHLVVCSRSPEGAILLSDLAARAAFVVRGL